MKRIYMLGASASLGPPEDAIIIAFYKPTDEEAGDEEVYRVQAGKLFEALSDSLDLQTLMHLRELFEEVGEVRIDC